MLYIYCIYAYPYAYIYGTERGQMIKQMGWNVTDRWNGKFF